MRALPALSLAYFGSTADGKTAGPEGAAGAAAGAASFFASFGAAGAGGAAAVGAAAGVASAPHWALRKSFHFWPPSVPADLAACYFALHSWLVRARPDGKEGRKAPHRGFARMLEGSRRQGAARQGAQEIPLRLQEGSGPQGKVIRRSDRSCLTLP